MRRFANVLLLTVMVTMLLVPLAMAGDCKDLKDGIGFKADFRWRSEFDGKDFDADTDVNHFCLMRARFGMIAKKDDLLGYVQLQSPFTLDAGGGLGTDPAEDVHQAYLKVNNLFVNNLWFQAGRFEMNYADQRLIGGVGWSQTGRAFEGVKIGYWNDTFWFDVFNTNLGEMYAVNNAKDDRFMGIWGGYKPMHIQAFILSKWTYDASDPDWETKSSLNTIGVHYSNKYDMGLYTRFNLAFQMGTDETYVGPGIDPVEMDKSAYLFTLEAFYGLDMAMKPWVGGGIDLTSGDDDMTDDKDNSFDNLYLTGHKFNGYMDIAPRGTAAGLRDIYLGAKVSPMDKMKVKLMFHNFATAVDYNNGSEDVSGIGNEIDAVMFYDLKENLAAEVGLGYFMPSEDYAGSDADNATWLYVQLQTKFDLFD